MIHNKEAAVSHQDKKLIMNSHDYKQGIDLIVIEE